MSDYGHLFRTDFAAPTKKMKAKAPTCAVSRLSYLKPNAPPQQIEDTLFEIAECMTNLPVTDAPWPKVGLQEHCTAFWNRYRLEALKLVAYLYGIDFKSRHKDELITRLIAVKAMLVSPAFLRDWYSRFTLVVADSADPGPAEEFVVDATASPPASPPSSSKRRKITIPRKNAAAASQALDAEEEEPAAPPQLITLTAEQFQKLLDQRLAPSTVTEASPGAVPTSISTFKKVDLAAFMSAVQTKISARSFTDPTALGNDFVETMELEDSGLNESSAKSKYDPFDPVTTPQGVMRWISMCAVNEAYSRAEIADYITWFGKVFWDAASTPDSKARYMKRFMHKHCAQPNWPALMDSDSLLLRNVLHKPPAVPMPSAQPSRTSGGAKGSGRGSSQPRKPSTLYCFAFCDQNKTVCSARGGSKCGFRHVCASCGGPHMAAACKAWIQATVDSNMKAAGHK